MDLVNFFKGGEEQLLLILGNGGAIDEDVVRVVLPKFNGGALSAAEKVHLP